VTSRREATRLLRKVDQPRAPHPTFARELRAELLGYETEDSQAQLQIVEEDDDAPPEIAVLPEPEQKPHRPITKRRWLAAAAAVVLLAGGGTWFVAAQLDDDEIVVSVSPETKKTVETACAAFRSSAFSELSRKDLIGPGNNRVLANVPSARVAISRLEQALRRFADDLREAGIEDPEVTVALDRSAGKAGSAIDRLDGGSVNRGASGLGEIDVELTEVEQRLIELGISESCL
jgi:hypothetical protein